MCNWFSGNWHKPTSGREQVWVTRYSRLYYRFTFIQLGTIRKFLQTFQFSKQDVVA